MTEMNGTRYPASVREKAVRRYLNGGVTYRELAQETGANVATVAYWVRKKREEAGMGKKCTDKNNRSAAKKMQLILEASNLEGEEYGAFLRCHGLRDAELIRWKEEALDGLLDGKKHRQTKQRAEDAEKKLRKVEKREKELNALVEMLKKAHALWAVVDDDTQDKSGNEL